jgi:hypothetical protein
VQKLQSEGAGKVAELIERHKISALLGAMAPDVPYYYGFGASSFENAAERIHGKDGEDTFDAIRDFAVHLSDVKGDERDYLSSFIIGFISHCIADWHFHPMIYYLTGDYYNSDSKKRALVQAYHRAFEVYLDAWFGEQTPSLWGDVKVSKLLRLEGSRFKAVCEMLSRSSTCTFEVMEEGPKAWRKGYQDLGLIQALCLSSPVGHGFRSLNKLLGGKLAPLAALAKAGRPFDKASFEQPITYKNPLTGVGAEERIDSLRDKAVDEFVSIVRQLEPLWLGTSADLRELLSDLKGKSLNVGLVGEKTSDAKFYSPEPPAFLLDDL